LNCPMFSASITRPENRPNDRQRDLEEEQIDKKGEVLQRLMQTTLVFVHKNDKSIVRFAG
jgi:hypothetical protein